MADMNKDDAVRSTNPVPPRSGSDTASAANISAGTSVGNAGQPATPYGQPATGAPIGQSNGRLARLGARRRRRCDAPRR